MKISRIKFKAETAREVLKPLLIRDLKNIKNKKILEIGCGQWDFAKKIIEKNNNLWLGLEPVDFQKNRITSVKGSVKNIPFHSNSFDYVICNQTMEHWFEYGVSFKKALNEIHRVLKSEGILMINSPIYNHGHPYFLRESLGKIKGLFSKKKWEIKVFEKCLPSKKYSGWKKIAGEGFFSRIGYPSILIRNHRQAFSYQLNIHVKKIGRPIKKIKTDRLRPLKVILRFAKELGFSYL